MHELGSHLAPSTLFLGAPLRGLTESQAIFTPK